LGVIILERKRNVSSLLIFEHLNDSQHFFTPLLHFLHHSGSQVTNRLSPGAQPGALALRSETGPFRIGKKNGNLDAKNQSYQADQATHNTP
jgi:hypothetical protein